VGRNLICGWRQKWYRLSHAFFEAIRPAARDSFVRFPPAELIDEAPTPLPLVGQDQVHDVKASLAPVSVRLNVEDVRSVRREERCDVLGYRAEPPGVLLGRHGCEAAFRVVLALAGVRGRCDAKGGAGGAEQAVYNVAVAAITAYDFVPRNCPNIADAGNRFSRSFGNLFFGIIAGFDPVVGLGQQHG